MSEAVLLSLPFTGLWMARNSPARRVPSHGSTLWGERYAIDFVGVDERRRTAARRDWRTFLASEPAERFLAFGRPILAPRDGVVVVAHDAEPDHDGRRSQLALVPYALGQAARLRRGVGAVAGNHVVLAVADDVLVALVHLRRVAASGVGDRVVTGQRLADCGSSGNSTQPHVHVQAMDSADLSVARGLPLAFRHFRERSRRSREAVVHEVGVPGEGAVVEPLDAA